MSIVAEALLAMAAIMFIVERALVWYVTVMYP